MGINRLDAIATLLATGSPRRRVLSACAAVLGGMALPGAALACKKIGKKCKKSKNCCDGAKCKKGKCKCKSGLVDCNGVCLSSCDSQPSCGDGLVDCNGVCSPSCNSQSTCESGLTECSGACLDLDRDEQHCGACNNSCIGRATCKNGVCTAPRFTFVSQWGGHGSANGEFRYAAGLALSRFGFIYVADL